MTVAAEIVTVLTLPVILYEVLDYRAQGTDEAKTGQALEQLLNANPAAWTHATEALARSPALSLPLVADAARSADLTQEQRARALSVILSILREAPAADERLAAIRTLQRLPRDGPASPMEAGPLTMALDSDPDPAVRAEAAVTLGLNLHTGCAHEVLRAYLMETDERVQGAAREGFRHISRHLTEEQIERLPAEERKLARSLIEIDEIEREAVLEEAERGRQ